MNDNIAKLYIDVLEDKLAKYERLIEKILRELEPEDSILSVVIEDLIRQTLKKEK